MGSFLGAACQCLLSSQVGHPLHIFSMIKGPLVFLLCCMQSAVCGLSATLSTEVQVVYIPDMQRMTKTVALFKLLLLKGEPCLALLHFIFATCHG